MIQTLQKRYIGGREFYRLVLTLALPLLLQNAVSTFVNLLDNLMVGRIGTESMSGVSIVNQLIFVYNLCLLGGTGGAGIFGAQFFGKGDEEGVRRTLRFNLLLCFVFSVLGITVLGAFQTPLIQSFLHDSAEGGDLLLTMREGRAYLRLMLWGLFPFAITTAYVSTLRVTGDNKLPMRASMTAIFVNLVLNWILIYGKLGFPVMGVRGAATATVISRYIELAIILFCTHRKRGRTIFHGVYRRFSIPSDLTRGIIRRGMPLLFNELFWSLSQTVLFQCYSVRGLTGVAALNITNTVSNLFNTVLFSLGTVVGIILGNLLGAEENDKAVDYCPKLIALSTCACVVTGLLLVLVAPFFPRLYKTTPEVMLLASQIIVVVGVMLPTEAIIHCTYWIMRAGGRTILIVIFDSVFNWVITVPLAWCLANLTDLGLLPIFILVYCTSFLKAAGGLAVVHRKLWVHNLVSQMPAGQ